MSGPALGFIGFILQIFAYLVIARALTSWFPNSRQYAIVQLLYQITDPVMIPLSRLIPRIGMIDLSPMILVFGLLFISSVLRGG
ncbi:MAG: YggT family protein [Chloroflexi bacterium]|nr:YggT family protein [Chloroflexota bacterium]MCI0775768.1 YggT family protein [Chloroflexota bacterium]MCI0804621.1 YggT family protein [Chloroflexota bacterium]MCI0809697.1 YggT family protein [Chloroflexota bacterium]MCI0834919.1 YggT family protein [Chloroflexota bacterium]